MARKAAKVVVVTNRKLMRELKAVLESASFVKIGILAKPQNKKAEKASTPHVDKNFIGPHKRKPLTVLEVGAIHEFGTGHIPQRSFLRSTWEDNVDKTHKVIVSGLKRHMKKGGDPKQNIHMALKFVGAWFVGRVKKKFTKNDWTALKDPSRGGKNFEHSSGFIGPPRKSMPLIDTGQLRASIGYEVVKVVVKERIALGVETGIN